MQTLLIRGLLSPSGHAAWTGNFCAAWWREREIHGHAVFNASIFGFFVFAVFLHAMWDIMGSISTDILAVNIVDYIGLAAKAKHLN
jgi:protease PrsW